MDRSLSKSRWRVWGLVILAFAALPSCAPQAVPVVPALSRVQEGLSPKDDAPLVFVPAGKFEMGSENHKAEEAMHRVIMTGFWIDQTEVTNGQYAPCVEQGVCQAPQRLNSYTRPEYFGNPQYDTYPVIYVTWDDADIFCRWDGRRMPTEAEWERAARGSDERVYPWGDETPQPDLLNYDFSTGDTTSVGRYLLGASPYKALDMAGNVEEWVADWYAADYYSQSARSDPRGPIPTKARVVRGGSWLDNRYAVRSALRLFYPPQSAFVNLGFRCAVSMDVTPTFTMGGGHGTRR